jgi:plasmid stability protein
MATLYVENVPDDLYEALRKRARSHRRSIAAEVLSLLERHIPTEKEMRARREAFRKIKEFQFGKVGLDELPSSVEMIREDRER